MTTTAKEIKRIKGYIEILKKDLDYWERQLEKEQQCVDLEPVECWAILKANSKEVDYFSSAFPHGARDRNKNIKTLREVTPQDEQDRKDAARYRKAKEWLTNSDFLIDAKPQEWDKLIDKAMQDSGAQ